MKNKVIYNMTNAQYHAQTDYFSSTFGKEAEKNSLQHAMEAKVELGWETQAVGDSLHANVLEPEKDLVVCGPETRRGKEWKEAQLAAEMDGKILLTAKLYDQVKYMAESLLARQAFSCAILPQKLKYAVGATFTAKILCISET